MVSPPRGRNIQPQLLVLACGARLYAFLPSYDIANGHGQLCVPLKGDVAGHDTSTCSSELHFLFKGYIVVCKWNETTSHPPPRPRHRAVGWFRDHWPLGTSPAWNSVFSAVILSMRYLLGPRIGKARTCHLAPSSSLCPTTPPGKRPHLEKAALSIIAWTPSICAFDNTY